jgi:nucleotide-binding universal stress UspA family protein
VRDPFRNALLATQGTEFDAGAERVAIDLAARFGIRLFAVLPLVSHPEYESIAPSREDAAEAEAADRLAALREAAAARGIEFTATVRRGEEPYREIIAEARERQADLIVLRRRGRRGFLANLLIGEMVHAVTVHAPCHVLIVAREAGFWSRGIALATDGSPHGERATQVAVSIALRCNLPLTVVSVAGADDPDPPAAQARVDRALQAARAAGVRAQGRVDSGRPHEAILRAAEGAGADLLVLGRRGLNPVRRVLLGSTSERVASHANCPVLIVHAEP